MFAVAEYRQYIDVLYVSIRRHYLGLFEDGFKNALLNAQLEDGFLCLPDKQLYPIGEKSDYARNTMPSKLLVRDFHKEINLILQLIRASRMDRGFGGAIFFGPSGIGKRWSLMSVLIDELKRAEVEKNCVVWFWCNFEYWICVF